MLRLELVVFSCDEHGAILPVFPEAGKAMTTELVDDAQDDGGATKRKRS